MNSKKYIIEILKNNCNTVELKINLHKEIDLAPFKKNKVYFIEDTEELYMYMYIDDDGVFYKIDINEFIKYSKMKILE